MELNKKYKDIQKKIDDLIKELPKHDTVIIGAMSLIISNQNLEILQRLDDIEEQIKYGH